MDNNRNPETPEEVYEYLGRNLANIISKYQERGEEDLTFELLDIFVRLQMLIAGELLTLNENVVALVEANEN